MLLKSSCLSLLTFHLLVSSMAWGELSNERVDGSLAKGASSVWYDENEKSLTFPSAESLQAAEDALNDRHRNIYVEQPVIPNAVSNGNQTWWDPIVEFLSVFVPWFLWGLLVVFLVAVAFYIWMAVKQGGGVGLRSRNLHAGDARGRENAKLVDLPFNIDASTRSLREQAQAFRSEGDYSKSIVYLFSHILVEMDEANCIRLQRGKTNHIYLRELRNDPQLAKLYQHTVRVFEAVFFGRYSVNQEQCERFWSLLPTIQQSIREAVQRRATSTDQNRPVRASPNASNIAGGIKATSLLVLAGMLGCSDTNQWPLDNYGGSNAYDRKSVSGLTVFRELCEQRNHKTVEMISLSERSHQFDMIVWAPKDFRVPNDEEIEWFDDWLSNNPNRKLIWVGRDYSPASHYWRKAAESSSPEDRRTFRLQEAYAVSEFESFRLRSATSLKCPWFEQQLGDDVGFRVEKFKGPWAYDADIDIGQSDIVLRGKLMPMQEPSTNLSTSKPDADVPHIQTLLASSDGSPIVSSISRQRWKDSKLILVANGSVLMNEALANRSNHYVAERLVDQSSPKGRIGFLSNFGDTRIRLPWEEQEPKGFEWLRVWPLSLIAIQGLFVGLVALLAMLPIFGRPQRLPSPSTTDFGKHIEALGDLLARTRDRNYALQRIADYFRDVRRDSASPWSNVAPTVSTKKTAKSKPQSLS
jgi:Domain of unknown function (DUF4129)